MSGSTGMRENEISKGTEIWQVGTRCLACHHQQSNPTKPAVAMTFLPRNGRRRPAVGIYYRKLLVMQNNTKQ